VLHIYIYDISRLRVKDPHTRQGIARQAHRPLGPHGRKISGFWCDTEEIFALLSCYAAYVLSLPTFRDSQYVQLQGSDSPRNSWTVWPLNMEPIIYPERSGSPRISWIVWPLKMEPIGCPETSVKKLRTYAAEQPKTTNTSTSETLSSIKLLIKWNRITYRRFSSSKIQPCKSTWFIWGASVSHKAVHMCSGVVEKASGATALGWQSGATAPGWQGPKMAKWAVKSISKIKKT